MRINPCLSNLYDLPGRPWGYIATFKRFKYSKLRTHLVLLVVLSLREYDTIGIAKWFFHEIVFLVISDFMTSDIFHLLVFQHLIQSIDIIGEIDQNAHLVHKCYHVHYICLKDFVYYFYLSLADQITNTWIHIIGLKWNILLCTDIIKLLNLQLPVKSVRTTVKVVSSNLVHDEVYSIQHWLETGRWFSPFIPVSSTNKTDRHGITT